MNFSVSGLFGILVQLERKTFKAQKTDMGIFSPKSKLLSIATKKFSTSCFWITFILEKSCCWADTFEKQPIYVEIWFETGTWPQKDKVERAEKKIL